MRNWPLWVTLLLAFVSFLFGMSARITPEMYRDLSPSLGYVFVPDDDTFIDSEHRLEVQFVRMGSEAPARVTAFISRSHDEPVQELEFEPLTFRGDRTRTWFAVLPPLHDKADKWFYHIEIQTTEGRSIEIWKRMNWFERLFTGFKKERQKFWVTYEGNIVREMPLGKLVLVSHIVLSVGALLFVFHTLYSCFWLLAAPDALHMMKAYRTMLGAWITFTFGTIILGPPITWYTFGEGFAPWPVRGLTSLGDITDTKSVLLVVWWGVLLLTSLASYRSAVRGDMEESRGWKFAIWTFVAILVTVFVFLIPHSQFL